MTARNQKQAMGKILIIDNQQWVVELLYHALPCDGYLVVVAPDAVEAMGSIKTNRFEVLLSLYLKNGYCVWNVLKYIKIMAPNLPVIILAAYDKYLYTPELDLADAYVVRSWSAAEELRRQVNAILGHQFQVSQTPLSDHGKQENPNENCNYSLR